MIVSGKSAGKPNRGGLVGTQHNGQVCVHYLTSRIFSPFFNKKDYLSRKGKITFLEKGRWY
jgi:hypothetical protein